jgi:hypothetical protein
VAGIFRLPNFDCSAAGPQCFQRWPRELAATPAAGSGIDDSEIGFHEERTIANLATQQQKSKK